MVRLFVILLLIYEYFAAFLRSLYSDFVSGMIFPQLSHMIPRFLGMLMIGIPKSVIRNV